MRRFKSLFSSLSAGIPAMIEAAIGSILDGPNANGYSTTPDRDAASAGSQTASQNPLSTLKPHVPPLTILRRFRDTTAGPLSPAVARCRIEPGAYHLEAGANADPSQVAVITPDPVTVAQACDSRGPCGQFHQFSVASTVPAPILSIATPDEKSLKWTFNWPVGALNPTSMASLSNVFREMAVPVIGAMLKMLMAVGPLVGALGLSGPFPEKWFPTITLSFRFTGGAIGGAAWLCMATPVEPLSIISLSITTFPVSVLPGPGAKIPTPAPAPLVPFPIETLREMVLYPTPNDRCAPVTAAGP